MPTRPTFDAPSGGDDEGKVYAFSEADNRFELVAPAASAPEVLIVALSDEITDLASTGNPKLTMRAPHTMTVSEVRASLTTASSSGPVTVDINKTGSSILSTKLTIDANERTSVTAATPAVISVDYLADDAEITFDIDAAGTGARGLKVAMIGVRGGTAPPASITFVDKANTTYGSRTNTTVNAPAGLIDGDYIILGILIGEASADPADPTPPAGFTLIAGPTVAYDGSSFAIEMRVYGKVASGEGSSWTFTHSAHTSQGFSLAYRGVNTGTPLDVTPTAASGSGTTSTASSLTPVTNNAMIVWLGHDWGALTANLSPPSGTTPTFTERLEVNPLIYVADGLLATAGATGTKAHTNNNDSSIPWAAYMIALRPA